MDDDVAMYKLPPMLLKLNNGSVTPPCRANCGCVVEAMRCAAMLDEKIPTLDVPTFRPPINVERLVEVESREPTVNCEVVAIKVVPAASDVMTDPAAKAVAFVPPFATAILVPFHVPVVMTPVLAVTINPFNDVTPVKAPREMVRFGVAPPDDEPVTP